jgi:hypothetical protein
MGGDLTEKPGFVRISLHPTMIDSELDFIIKAVAEIAENYQEWAKDYTYNTHNNEFYHKDEPKDKTDQIVDWFKF